MIKYVIQSFHYFLFTAVLWVLLVAMVFLVNVVCQVCLETLVHLAHAVCKELKVDLVCLDLVVHAVPRATPSRFVTNFPIDYGSYVLFQF